MHIQPHYRVISKLNSEEKILIITSDRHPVLSESDLIQGPQRGVTNWRKNCRGRVKELDGQESVLGQRQRQTDTATSGSRSIEYITVTKKT